MERSNRIAGRRGGLLILGLERKSKEVAGGKQKAEKMAKFHGDWGMQGAMTLKLRK
jgi:hypothetical protein